ncbi:MAG: hypothetical protein NVS9B4_12910 [Candidatus Acidiferrum sp.]
MSGCITKRRDAQELVRKDSGLRNALLWVGLIVAPFLLNGCAVVGASNKDATLKPGSAPTAQPQLAVTPGRIDFGKVSVGTTASNAITVRNAGGGSLNIAAISSSGTAFSVSGIPTPAALASGQTAVLNVVYSPKSSSADSGSVIISSNDPLNPTAKLALTGSGTTSPVAQLQLNPPSVAFGNVANGTINTQSVQLNNTGSIALTISTASVTGSGFSITGLSTPLTIGAGQSSSFTVKFAPQSVGGVSGNVVLMSDAANSPSALSLSGAGVTGTYALSVNPVSLSFGNTSMGTASSKSFSITNSGNSDVSISQINVSGPGFSANSAGALVTLSPSQSATVSVQFSPAASGAASGNVSIVSNASSTPTVTLSGAGVTVAAHSVALNWNPDATVTGFNVYRSSSSGTGYAKLNGSLVASTSYSDTSVQNTQTYYYVTTAVDSAGAESVYSNEVSANIP